MGLINDGSPPGGRYGMLVASFIAASRAMKFLDMDEEQRRQILLNELEASYGKEAANARKLTMHTMMEEKWSTGCPVAAPTPGTWTSNVWATGSASRSIECTEPPVALCPCKADLTDLIMCVAFGSEGAHGHRCPVSPKRVHICRSRLCLTRPAAGGRGSLYSARNYE